MNKLTCLTVFCLLTVILSFVFANEILAGNNIHFPLTHVEIDLKDEAALQRGAKIYMNYCSSCHSLKYMRYNRMAKDIDITTLEGEVDEDLLKEHLIFDKKAKITSTIESALPSKDAISWFGLPTPDLSLTVRARGADWVATYLKSFYRDDTQKPWGVNNLLYSNAAMPNVLERLQGVRVPLEIDGVNEHQGVIQLAQLTPGDLTPAEFDQTITDVVTFLAYVAEPTKLKRQALGWWVIGFLLIFATSAYFLKREYWKDVK